MKWSIFFANILIHVGIMSLFLTIFFFTIAQYFERKVVEKQIDFVMDDFVGNALAPLSNDEKNNIKKQIDDSFSNMNLNKQDNDVKKQNSKTQKKAWKFVGIILSITTMFVLIFGFLYKWEPYYLKFLLSSAVISLIFIAITETLFMFLIAQNYLSADPNKIKLNIIDTLANNRCDPNSTDKTCIKKN